MIFVTNLQDARKYHYNARGVGHYGTFNVVSFRTEITAAHCPVRKRVRHLRATFIPVTEAAGDRYTQRLPATRAAPNPLSKPSPSAEI